MVHWFRRTAWYWLVGALTIAVTGFNLFGFPYLGGDEGIYVSQGWWSVAYGKLAPYVYTYDHSPLGWMQIGVWQKLTGGPFTFGVSVLSGRVLMLLIVTLTAVLLLDLAARLTQSRILGFLTAIIFAFSPMAVRYHRWVLLDNIAIFWVIASLWLVVRARSKLTIMWLSGIVFGLAVLSKEVVAIWLPAFVWLVFRLGKRENRSLATMVWAVASIGIMAIYPLFALLRGELFPVAWFGGNPHVSLIETLMSQAGRGSGKSFWQAGSDLREVLKVWWQDDWVIMVLGGWSLLVNLIASWRSFLARVVVVFNLLFIFFLARGGVILGFYILPLIPFLAMSVAIAFGELGKIWNWRVRPVWMGISILMFAGLWVYSQNKIFIENQTRSQVEALSYVKKNIEPNKVVIVDMNGFLDLRLANSLGPAFPNAELYQRIEFDPDLKKEKVAGRWQNVDYILLNVGMVSDFARGRLPFLREVFDHSKIVADFPPGPQTFRDIGNLAASDGDWATLMKVEVSPTEKTNASQLSQLLVPGKEEIDKLSIEERVAKLLWVGIDGTRVSPDYANWLESGLGGVVIRGENVGNQEEFDNLVKTVKMVADKSRVPGTVLLVSDEEGGRVSRLAKLGVDDTPQYLIDTPDQAYGIAHERGVRMAELGVKINLAPAAEVIANNGSYAARSKRAFLGDENEVADKVGKMIDGMSDAGVVAIPKHFPGGLGRTASDPHLSLPTLSKLGVVSIDADLEPFKRAVGVGAKAIMVTHLLYPQVDSKYPTSLSKVWISDVLRDALGFKGAIVLDDMSMGALNRFSDQEKAERFFEAGADIALVTGDYSRQRGLFEAMVSLVREGKVGLVRLNESVVRAILLAGE